MKKAYLVWLQYAERDLLAASHSLKEGDYYLVSFLSQQAAEKTLKALSIKKFKEVLKVHNLVFLARNVGAPKEIIKICDSLTARYFTVRYPDAADESVFTYSRTDAMSDLINAGKVVKWTKKRL